MNIKRMIRLIKIKHLDKILINKIIYLKEKILIIILTKDQIFFKVKIIILMVKMLIQQPLQHMSPKLLAQMT